MEGQNAPLTVHRLTLSSASVSLYLPLLFSIKKFTPTSRSSSVLSKFLFSSCCVFCSHKCLVSLFFYSSTTVVCILISTIPRKWVRLGFNCLFTCFFFCVFVCVSFLCVPPFVIGLNYFVAQPRLSVCRIWMSSISI